MTMFLVIRTVAAKTKALSCACQRFLRLIQPGAPRVKANSHVKAGNGKTVLSGRLLVGNGRLAAGVRWPFLN
jgi:hypothetical protein